jgi:MoaA/NifB/PqqE/SkfB family radical SAM enzyme
MDVFKINGERIDIFLNKLKKISTERILNLISSNLARKFGIFISELHPVEFFFEVVRGCNFKCIMCNAWKFPKLSITYEQAKRIFPYFRKSLMFHAYGIGEPFLNRDIYDIVKYASFSLKFIVGITSNFSVIDPQKAINMGANEIMASIDSLDPEKFFLLRKGNLDRVIENLKAILSLKQKNSQKFPIISIRTLISNENIDELENIVRFGLSIGVKKFYFQDSADGYLLRKITQFSSEDINRVIQLKEKFKNKAKIYIYLWDSKAQGSIPKGYCFNAFFMGTIGYDGELYTCCRYFGNKEASLGNILKDPQRALKNRLMFLKKFRSDPPDFCKNCETYCRMCKKKMGKHKIK